ncbi:YbhB/YbcL family Raf kinase inhibitor-like protein [Oligoflexus sp.]|uniref:YbhB/YbcL family Raf kinase inhibitor-like protein n=1 Tax=Oligoflexus sp. TaxID=1971216 RepID=UPI002D79C26B|nr:YbhB/YbcL family Raf kinase inhibitor-like protein [Oligoflexus sp.]
MADASAAKGGMNQSPPLQWKSSPAGTAFFAIQMLDLDNGNPPTLHWMISNIPATSTQLPAAVPAGNNLAALPEAVGATQMKAYGGPNPPAAHRYELTIYGIKAGQTLNLVNNNSTANKTELEAKSISKATLVGIFTP